MSVGLTARQRAIIRGTCQEAKQRYAHLPTSLQRLAAVIATSTMFCESGCRVLANANVPASWSIPHDLLPWSADGLGHDHASVGSYQQQTGTAWTVPKWATTMGSPNGWGTPRQLMTPATAAGKFFAAMDKRGGPWRTQPTWVTAQNVQVSAYDGRPREANNYSGVYGGNYRGQRVKAKAAVLLLWPTVSASKPVKSLPAPKPARPNPKPVPRPRPAAKPVYVRVRAGQYLALIAANNHTTVQRLQQLNAKLHPSIVSRPDYLQVGWKVRVK